MKIYTINNLSLKNQIHNKSNTTYSSNVSFNGLFDFFAKKQEFFPSCSITDNPIKYAKEVYKNWENLSKSEINDECKRLYSLLKTEKEQNLFRMHFYAYMPQELKKNKLNTKNTQSQPIINKPVITPTKPHFAQKTLTTIYTKETILQEFESLENDDIPTFVAKIAKSSKEEQYNLLEIYKELFKKHDELMENDPSMKFKKEIREKYTEQLKKEIREEFDKSGKDYESTDVIKETYKRLDKMAQDAGLADYEQNTLKLGQKLATLRKQMEEQNISFVSKAPEFFETEERKWNYINEALWAAPKNEASAMDALDVFEKFGEKRFIDETTSVTSLDDLRTSISGYIDEILSKGILKNIFHNEHCLELTNVLLQRYIQVYSKFATNKIDSRAYPDVKSVWRMFDSYKHIANKDTMLMMINAMKDFAVDKEEYSRLKYFVKHFSPELYEVINKNDLQDIEKAIVKLGEKVENLPDNYLQD